MAKPKKKTPTVVFSTRLLQPTRDEFDRQRHARGWTARSMMEHYVHGKRIGK